MYNGRVHCALARAVHAHFSTQTSKAQLNKRFDDEQDLMESGVLPKIPKLLKGTSGFQFRHVARYMFRVLLA